MFNKRLFVILLLIYTSSLFLLGCNSESIAMDKMSDKNASVDESESFDIKEALSYGTAEDFEKALNNGDDVLGAVVTFSAGITEPGPGSYNMHAGKKLAFASSDHPNINPGSAVTVKVISVKNVEGTWYIEYER